MSRTLPASGAPYGCSVDPRNRDLAVSNLSSYLYGSISVYPKAAGKPKSYFNAMVNSTYFCGYDAHGNLLIDANDRSGAFILVELPDGGEHLKIVGPNDQGGGPVGFWKYPAGRSPYKTLAGLLEPLGATISR